MVEKDPKKQNRETRIDTITGASWDVYGFSWSILDSLPWRKKEEKGKQIDNTEKS